ncbi:hypothetical protein RRG08_031067 [Elysia crispata]|uniref:C-type lectin domain-containing protein n=1 Tax=Elysia crispata TaxID=231223 RepID=A0AAE0ZFC1_9GAST|nr:hypothetical protein RRG08_031067 [Elysia crispata]
MLISILFTLALLSASFAAVPEKCTWSECFNVIEELVSFQDAQRVCAAAGKGALAKIPDSRVNNYLANHFQASNVNVTTGLWIDVSANDAYTNFADDDISGNIHSDGVVMDPSQSFQWVVAPENDQFYTLCAKDLIYG